LKVEKLREIERYLQQFTDI